MGCTYFKLEGASSTLYPFQVNINLADFSDGLLKDRRSITLSKKDTKVVESLTRESSALLMALTQRSDQPNAATTMQPFLTDHFQTHTMLSLDQGLMPTNFQYSAVPRCGAESQLRVLDANLCFECVYVIITYEQRHLTF